MSQAGITTVLVLSGETRLEEVSLSPFTPDLIVKDVGELLEMLREA
jgi:ribonucleotide monophosphatase NagD (HAD superfamily)